MANVREIKRRIRSVQNIAQVTRAMQMVAASKMRRAQLQALASRPYARKLQTTLLTIAAMIGSTDHPLLKQNESGHAHEKGGRRNNIETHMTPRQ